MSKNKKNKIIRYSQAVETFSSTHFILDKEDIYNRLSTYLEEKLQEDTEMNTIDEVTTFIIQTLIDLSVNVDNNN